MRQLLSTVSPTALLFTRNQSLPPEGGDVKSRHIQVVWELLFPRNQVYIEIVSPSERKKIWSKFACDFLDWDKLWYAAVTASSGESIGVADSLEKLHKQLARTSAVLVRLH